ncbi:glycosyltransferase family 2 protein [Bombiscardovia coagulans]|uniref:Glycosyltransferase, group 2 family protein n=1 Tax=Bombiscardovia coagulans TaxID=686666 RepID=A0A261EPZ1_9BIFI|nr:glycosyltransferase [Bombiscardovia coagulans]OZG48919.1 glycosyltransferase, group 2 family protein [Bombiscardovia coagulans]
MLLHNSMNYQIEIDTVRKDSQSHQICVTGWAVDKLRHLGLDMTPTDEQCEVSRHPRPEISSMYELKDGVRPGFSVAFPQGKKVAKVKVTLNGEDKLLVLDADKIERQIQTDKIKSKTRTAVSYLSHAWTPSGFRALLTAVHRNVSNHQEFYERWIDQHENMTQSQAEEQIADYKLHPLVSIVVPVYNVDEQWLRKCVASVQNQWYSRWELCLADDCSPAEHVRPLLQELALSDSRIKVVERSSNGGIAEATNSAIALASGEYVGFMDNDDELAPNALFEMVKAINEDPNRDFLYSDEDKMTEEGVRFEPFFKPGFSPNLLLSHNYITHFVVVSKQLLDQVGGLSSDYDGSQDYDFVLRATEQAQQVHHIAKMLYHWRTLASSVAGDPTSKMYAYEAGQKAVEAALERRDMQGTVSMMENLGTYKIDYKFKQPSVAVLATGYSDELFQYLRQHTQYSNVAFVRCQSEDVNALALERQEDVLVFVNGLKPESAQWLEQMVNYSHPSGVGIVGGKIFDRNQRVDNAGVTLRAMRSGQPFEMRGQWDQGIGYYFRDILPHDMFAVTEDCMLITRQAFTSLHGFNANLAAGLKGIDLCVRARQQCNLSTLWQPYSSFVREGRQALTIPSEALQAYLGSHATMTDPFATAYFPLDERQNERVSGSIDEVSVSRDGCHILVKGWAVDQHRAQAADVSLKASSSIQVKEMRRLLRPDVNMTFHTQPDAEVGFEIRISVEPGAYQTVRADHPSLVFSSESGQVTEPLPLPASAALARTTAMMKKVTLLRHPRRLAHQLSDRYLAPRKQREAYRKLIERTERYDLNQVRSQIEHFQQKPVISVLVPVYNVDPQWLDRCVSSVRQQFYPHWELCLADDCSTDPRVQPLLERYAQEDSRIKVVIRKENGHISRATNSALEIASGEFIALLDNDDELAPQALFEVVKRLNECPQTDLIYSDEDKEDEQGNRSDPHFKPDYAPDLLLSTNYISHLGVYRKSIVDEIGGFRAGYEGSQDYDMVLRFVEHTSAERIQHIAKVLYHWRTLASSTASGSGAKDYASDAGLRALQSAMERRQTGAEVVSAGPSGIYNVHYPVAQEDLVSVIIPTKDGYDNIERCMDSILAKTTYSNYEVIIADNGSTHPAMRDLYQRYQEQMGDRFRVEEIDIPFNYPRINNIAASKAKGKYLLFLNDDTQVISPHWMTRMVSFAQLERVGLVGAKLYYPIETIQHAGIVLGLGGVAGHIEAGCPRTHLGYFGRLVENVNYYAVTAACCMIKADDFKAVGGFDEDLAVAYNDVDLCIRVHDQLGRDNVWAHEVELYHYESLTRGYDVKDAEKKARLEEESATFAARYQAIIDNDPYYNPNLSRTSGNFWVREV